MTNHVRILLVRLQVLETQHRAGITPPFGELEALFDTARLAREDVAAFDHGLTPRELRRSEAIRATDAPTVTDQDAVSVTVDVPLPLLAKALLKELQAAS
jgi:hypothetical protein